MPQEITATLINDGDDEAGSPPACALFSLSRSTSLTNDIFEAIGAGCDAEYFRVRGPEQIGRALEALKALAANGAPSGFFDDANELATAVCDIEATTVWFARC